MIVYGRLEARISKRTAKLVFTLGVDIYVESNKCVTIGAEFRPFYFCSLQFDVESLQNQITECLCTFTFALVKFTHFRRELECKAGNFRV